MAATSIILVDDSDVSRITYDPPSAWSNQGSSFEHNSTTHALAGAGTAKFKFNGTGVAAYGTVSQNTSWSGVKCNVDGKDYQGSSTTTSPTQATYNFLYCGTPDSALSDDKEHTFTISPDPSVSNTSSSGNWLYLDYILYDHTKGSSMNAVPGGTLAQVVVDDSRTDLIKYDGPGGSGSWSAQGGPLEYNQTTHGTATGGATATFEFTGTRVEVYGTIGISFPGSVFTSTYTIDGGSPVNFGSAGNQGTVGEYQMRFFQSNVLSDAKHTLVIMSTTQSSLIYYIDYIVYTTSELNPSPSGSGSPGSSSQTPSGTADPSPKSSNTGLIAGVSVAAVLVVIAAVVGFIVFLRKRRRRSASGGKYASALDLGGPSPGSPTFEPFIGNPAHQPSPYPHISGSENPTVSSLGPSVSVLAHGESYNLHTFPSASAATVPSSPSASSAFLSIADPSYTRASSTAALASDVPVPVPNLSGDAGSGSGQGQGQGQENSGSNVARTEKGLTVLTAPRPVVQHHDGGVRLRSDSTPEEEQEPEELPPVYQDRY